MDKCCVTILVLSSDSTGATRKIKLPIWMLKAARNFGIVLVLALGFIFYDYGNMRMASMEVDGLKDVNAAQKAEIQGLSSKISGIESRLAKLKSFDKKIRIIANLEEPNSGEEEPMGMGGASPDEEGFPTLGAKRNALIDQMNADLAQLESEASLQEESFTKLEGLLEEKSSLLSSTPSVLPSRGWITSTYGKRKDPFTARRTPHKGIDIANRTGTPVIAPADGIVTKVTRLKSLGRMVEVNHGYGIKTRYGHLSKSLVKVGKKVKRGDKIASMGSSGRSTGPHLHYEVFVNGVNVNPSKYILD